MDPILDDVNPEQRAAITHGEGPLLVVAGAGSGKTRVITRRVAHLVRRGVAPRHIVALTFTNKAAQEMRDRVQALVAAPELWVRTFHSFAARLLRQYGDRLGYTREFTIYDTEDQKQLLKALLKEMNFDDLRPAEVSHSISRHKNGLGRVEAPGWRAERISTVMRAYGERLRAANAMDFDDLLVNIVALLEIDEIREHLCDRMRWILVDEYQDTNKVQYEILHTLAQPRRNVCATGDPDQSIYRWRGATIRNILDFERDFPGATVITLDRNYRSTKTILSVANAVIRHNTGRHEKDLRTANDAGVRVREARCIDEGDEARVCAREVKRWTGAGRSARDIALFYRVNSQSRALERGLRDAAVPYRIVGAVEFFKRKEVKDILAYLRLARNPLDGVAFRRIFNVPTRGLGVKTEQRLLEQAARSGVTPRALLRVREGLARFGRARKALAAFADLLDKIEAIPSDDPALYLERLIDEVGYRRFLGEGTAAPETDRLENADELINAASEYSRREPEGGIDGFLEENALVSDQDAYDPDAECVTLMTVHSAKGLEFPCVMVTGLEDGLFPHAFSLDTDEEVEEERRLFYVAVTRAEDELVLTHAESRFRSGAPTRAMPSRFLDEIPEEHLEVEDRLGFSTAEPDPLYGGDEDVFALDDVESVFAVGERVKHDHFGQGRVVAVRRRGAATRITVDFVVAGRRELSLTYARLKRMS